MPDNNDLRRFYALLDKAGMKAHKDDILSGYGVDSVKSLSQAELSELCTRLSHICAEKVISADKERRIWRSNVLTMLQKIGIYADNQDWSRVNKFLMQPRISGKLLYELSIEELKALHRKLLAIYRKDQERKQKNDWLATNN